MKRFFLSFLKSYLTIPRKVISNSFKIFYAIIAILVLSAFSNNAYALPDLYFYRVSNGTGTVTINEGTTTRLSMDIGNRGTTCVNGFFLHTYISSSSTFNPSNATLMGSAYKNLRLCSGNDGDVSTSRLQVANYTPGTYYAHYVIDKNNNITESNESNNIATVTIIIRSTTPTVDPDFTIVSNFRVDVERGNSWVNDVDRAEFGDYIRIAYTIRNLTAGTSNERLFVSVIWSRDASLQTVQDNVLLGEKRISTLGGNASLNDIISNIFVPNVGNVGFGSGHILLIADLFDRIEETNENNNIVSRSFAIFVPSGRMENTIAKNKDAGFKSDTDKLGSNLVPFSHEMLTYPNPFTDQLNLTMSTEGKSHISVHNISGRLIWRKEYEGFISESIDMNGQPSGIYMLKLTNQSGTLVRKIIKE